jgi:TPR repeat protein
VIAQVPKIKLRLFLMVVITLLLFACAAPIAIYSQLEQGKRYIEAGYYKKAMQELLAPACDGSPEAQYAVGYMYYYGYGVAQDTDVGYFWIRRAANRGYPPALKAIALIRQQNSKRTFRQYLDI